MADPLTMQQYPEIFYQSLGLPTLVPTVGLGMGVSPSTQSGNFGFPGTMIPGSVTLPSPFTSHLGSWSFLQTVYINNKATGILGTATTTSSVSKYNPPPSPPSTAVFR